MTKDVFLLILDALLCYRPLKYLLKKKDSVSEADNKKSLKGMYMIGSNICVGVCLLVRTGASVIKYISF